MKIKDLKEKSIKLFWLMWIVLNVILLCGIPLSDIVAFIFQTEPIKQPEHNSDVAANFLPVADLLIRFFSPLGIYGGVLMLFLNQKEKNKI